MCISTHLYWFLLLPLRSQLNLWSSPILVRFLHLWLFLNPTIEVVTNWLDLDLLSPYPNTVLPHATSSLSVNFNTPLLIETVTFPHTCTKWCHLHHLHWVWISTHLYWLKQLLSPIPVQSDVTCIIFTECEFQHTFTEWNSYFPPYLYKVMSPASSSLSVHFNTPLLIETVTFPHSCTKWCRLHHLHWVHFNTPLLIETVTFPHSCTKWCHLHHHHWLCISIFSHCNKPFFAVSTSPRNEGRRNGLIYINKNSCKLFEGAWYMCMINIEMKSLFNIKIWYSQRNMKW